MTGTRRIRSKSGLAGPTLGLLRLKGVFGGLVNEQASVGLFTRSRGLWNTRLG